VEYTLVASARTRERNGDKPGKEIGVQQPLDELRTRLTARKAVIGVIGLGYVGLPQALAFAESGFHVIGFDIDVSKTDRINSGESYLHEFSSERVRRLVQQGTLRATNDFAQWRDCDVAVICVPTPLTEYREPDLTYITRTVESLIPSLHAGQLVVLVSTTYPGTTEELVRGPLEGTGLIAGRDIAVGYAPEREDPGNPGFGLRNTPKLVSGCTSVCRDLVELLYRPVVSKVVTVSDTRVAESAKLLENTYRAVNIALVNELKSCFDRMGLDVWEVIEAASTKPFGFTPFYPGPGLGGHCIPIDPFYLTWKAREYDFHTRFIELAGEINTSMPEYVISRLRDGLDRLGIPLKRARILVLGVAYKRDTADLRESPALRILSLLSRAGAALSYHDPYVSHIGHFRKYRFDLASVPLTPEVLQGVHAALIVTDHTSVDYAMVVQHAPLVVDTRNATRDVAGYSEKILKA
jgi:UDP-N-acetyl-D-glucosamine dehydrogenase